MFQYNKIIANLITIYLYILIESQFFKHYFIVGLYKMWKCLYQCLYAIHLTQKCHCQCRLLYLGVGINVYGQIVLVKVKCAIKLCCSNSFFKLNITFKCHIKDLGVWCKFTQPVCFDFYYEREDNLCRYW